MAEVVLGVDIGGTKLAAGLVDADGRVLHADRVATMQGASGDDLWRSLVELTERVVGGGIAEPSPVSGSAAAVRCNGPAA